jgi:hypothetical protein
MSVVHLFLAFLLRLWGPVYYAHPMGCLAKPRVVAKLGNFGIKMLDCGNASEYLYKNYEDIQGRVTDLVLDKIFSRDTRFDVLRSLFVNIENFDQKFRIVTGVALQAYLGRIPHLMLWAEHFKKEGEVVLVSVNRFASMIARNAYFGSRSFYPSWCFYLSIPFQFASWFLKRGWARFLKVRTRSLQEGHSEGKKTDLSGYSVLFFPHKGLVFGGLFTKTYYHSNDPCSPFYSKNILHIETHGLPPEMSMAQRRRIVDFYDSHELPFHFLSKKKPISELKSALQFGWFLVGHLADMLALARRYKIFSILLLGQIYLRYRFYVQCMSKMKNARVAVVGYDLLFSTTLALALETLNVVTVGAQERYASPYQTDIGCILDHYLSASEHMKHVVEQNPRYAYASIKAIGQIRTDKIYEFQRNGDSGKEFKRILGLKRERRILLALDYHSRETVIGNCSATVTNWKFNKEFYSHLIKLAAEFPDVYFIIRGKTDRWTKLDYFKEVHQRIKATPNMEVHQNYKEYDLSYKIAAVADCVITRYTSLGDEALAAKIPVLIHDKFGQAKGLTGRLYNPGGLPIYVNSYEELCLKLREILSGESFFHGEEFKEKLRQLYGNFFDGKVQQRLHKELRRIYEESAQTKIPDREI